MDVCAPEDLRTRERRVHEQPNRRVRQRLPQERRDEEQVVVVDPDEVAWLVHLLDATREGLVDGGVGRPVRVGAGVLGRDVLPEEVVEERPESWGGRRVQYGLNL